MFVKPLKKNPLSFQQLTVADKFKLKSKLTTKKYSSLLVFDKILVAVNIATSVCLTTIPLLWCFILCIHVMNNENDYNSRALADDCCAFFPFFYDVGGKRV